VEEHYVIKYVNKKLTKMDKKYFKIAELEDKLGILESISTYENTI